MGLRGAGLVGYPGRAALWIGRGLETMGAYRSVPPWEILDSQVVEFRAEIGAVGAGLVAAAGDDTMPFWDHCRGADALLRARAEAVVEFLGKVGDHRLGRGHREAARLMRDWLAGEKVLADAPEDWVERCQAWQQRTLDLKKGLRVAAQGDAERRERKGKNRTQLQMRVPVAMPGEAVADAG